MGGTYVSISDMSGGHTLQGPEFRPNPPFGGHCHGLPGEQVSIFLPASGAFKRKVVSLRSAKSAIDDNFQGKTCVIGFGDASIYWMPSRSEIYVRRYRSEV